MARDKGKEERGDTNPPTEGQASGGSHADPRHDHRLTVVNVYASRGGTHDIVEAVATVPGPAPRIRRFKFMLDGVYVVAFGWLIGVADERHVLLFDNPDSAGEAARLRARVQELQPIE